MLDAMYDIAFVSYAEIFNNRIYCFPESYSNRSIQVFDISNGNLMRIKEIALTSDLAVWTDQKYLLMWSGQALAIITSSQDEFNLIEMNLPIELVRADNQDRILVVEKYSQGRVQFHLYTNRLEPLATKPIKTLGKVIEIVFSHQYEYIRLQPARL